MTATHSFRQVFGKDPTVSAYAPGRVNLIGDHTDYNQGYVLPTVIPLQTTVEAATGSGQHAVYSATLDRMVHFDGGELSDFARYVGGCVRILEARGVEVPPLQLRIGSDVPVASGLASSAALEVATIRAIDALLKLTLGAEEIALLAHKAEVEYAGVACGIMDQMACSLGHSRPDAVFGYDDTGAASATDAGGFRTSNYRQWDPARIGRNAIQSASCRMRASGCYARGGKSAVYHRPSECGAAPLAAQRTGSPRRKRKRARACRARRRCGAVRGFNECVACQSTRRLRRLVAGIGRNCRCSTERASGVWRTPDRCGIWRLLRGAC